MRDRSNTISTMAQINTCVEVSVSRMTALPTPKRLFVPLSLLSEPTTRASQAGSGWVQQNDCHAINRGQQLDPASKVTSGPLFPANHACWVFQRNASTRAQTHGDCFSGFAGNALSRRTCGVRAVNPSTLLVCSPLFLFLQNRSEINTLMPIAPHDSGSDADITAQPSLRLLDFSQRHRDVRIDVPLPVFSHDIGTALGSGIQDGSRQGQGAIERPMPTGRNIQLVFRAFQQNPVIKAFGLFRKLKICTVNEFCFQESRRMACFGRAPIINPSAAVGSPNKFAHALCDGRPSLFLAQEGGAVRMRTAEEGRQKRQRVSLVDGGIELQLVGQNHGLHVSTLAKRQQKTTPPIRRLVSGQYCPLSGEPRLRFGSPIVGGASPQIPASKEGRL